MNPSDRRLAIVGGGWAGLAAAVRAVELGWRVTVLEASRHWGGRARGLTITWPDALPNPAAQASLQLDNGQHILIGAYTATLNMMRTVGVRLDQALLPMPLALPFPDGSGLATPAWAQKWPAPLDILGAIATASGWTWRERAAFLFSTIQWRLSGFRCAPSCTVAELCHALPQRVRLDLIEPLCVAALNTPAERASGQVFLRVLHDALLGQGVKPYRSADLLLPRTDLGRLFPDTAADWLQARGCQLALGSRVHALRPEANGWRVESPTLTESFDQVILACPVAEATRLLDPLAQDDNVRAWLDQAASLKHEPIATTYVATANLTNGKLASPMLALRSSASEGPAQFVFDRSYLGGPSGLLAFVASACEQDRNTLQAGVLRQAREQLGLTDARGLLTVIEKRATFACEPLMQRPGACVKPGLWAAGDAIDGPYPATLEGAVRSGLAAIARLSV